LTEKGFSPAYGARFLKRHIDQKVKLPITNEWKLGRILWSMSKAMILS
jgi:ATP-dependent Clp protease ATP-binding subunit ClpA